MEKRSYKLDALKGIAIIGVVLYHFGGGLFTFGYLGVDIFFVVSGYFMMKSIVKAMQANTFSYWRFLVGKIARLWPLVLIMVTVALGIGILTMLPDDLENLSESVIASNVFANNILSFITTKNYWDVVNVFKPLMHTWYVGVLMQAYVFLPLIYWMVFKLAKGSITPVKISAIVILLLSLLAYLLPIASTEMKFYFLPFRAFEITIGSCLAFSSGNKEIARGKRYLAEILAISVMLVLLFTNITFPSASVKLLLTVFLTAVLVYVVSNTEENVVKFLVPISCIGRASFSIYLCHQIVVAFMYYAVTARADFGVFLLFVAVVSVLSIAVYFALERPLERVVKRNVKRVLIASAVLCFVTSAASGLIYLHAGVVRDVPELGIEKGNAHRGMHAEYCDIPYSWDREFSSFDKVKVVVIGDSFGRDWANILNESSISEQLEISYIYSAGLDDVYEKNRSRLLEADLVFRSFSSSTINIEKSLPNMVPVDKLYIIGYKNFGSSNGIIYFNRWSDEYFEQSIRLDDDVLKRNQVLIEKYGDHYIDMISPVQNSDGSVRVFTDDHYFISQDCRHLTKYGAQYYAKLLDLSWIVEGKDEA